MVCRFGQRSQKLDHLVRPFFVTRILCTVLYLRRRLLATA